MVQPRQSVDEARMAWWKSAITSSIEDEKIYTIIQTCEGYNDIQNRLSQIYDECQRVIKEVKNRDRCIQCQGVGADSDTTKEAGVHPNPNSKPKPPGGPTMYAALLPFTRNLRDPDAPKKMVYILGQVASLPANTETTLAEWITKLALQEDQTTESSQATRTMPDPDKQWLLNLLNLNTKDEDSLPKAWKVLSKWIDTLAGTNEGRGSLQKKILNSEIGQNYGRLPGPIWDVRDNGAHYTVFDSNKQDEGLYHFAFGVTERSVNSYSWTGRKKHEGVEHTDTVFQYNGEGWVPVADSVYKLPRTIVPPTPNVGTPNGRFDKDELLNLIKRHQVTHQ